MTPERGAATVLRWLRHAQFRAQPGRTMASVAAVAIGVMLALAIHLVNASALDSFRQAIATVNGDADAQIRPRRDCSTKVCWTPSPGLPVSQSPAPCSNSSSTRGSNRGPNRRPPGAASPRDAPRESLKLVAIDLFAAARVTPGLLPVAPEAQGSGYGSGATFRMFEPDAVFLSAAAEAAFPARALLIDQGSHPTRLTVAGRVPGAAPGQVLAVMDLGAAQWAFGAVGRLSRIDLKLEPGSARRTTLDRLRDVLPDGVQIVTPEADEQRMSNLSRAYRVNLSVLALVALLTGGFIVFATLSLAAVRQQQEMALVIVLGAAPGTATRALLWQGALVGLWGSLLGMAGGIGLAYLLLNTVGGDLGGGYFSSGAGSLAVRPLAVLGFGALGCITAVLGSLAPARSARHLPAAQVLKSGSQEATFRRLRPARIAAALVVLGLGLLLAPPVAGLPVAAYLAIAAFLFAGVSLVPLVIERVLGWFSRRAARALWRHPGAWLALTRQTQAPASAAVALAGVVASFALTCAMVIMVSSFRLSVDDWLLRVLPADLYGRAPAVLEGSIDPSAQNAIAAIPGIDRVQFLRSVDLALDPGRAPVLLLARSLTDRPIEQQLPLSGAPLQMPRDAGAVAVYVSEAMVSLYGFEAGSLQSIPLAGRQQRVFVAGVWRDYARQTGAITMDLADYRALTGDGTVSDVAVWLADPDAAGRVIADIRSAAPVLAQASFRSAADIRALSLRIFDRSFAVTYVLEAIAIVVGLFGVASTYAAEALNRAREFGMLRHLGVSRLMVMGQLAIEACAGTLIALIWGGAIGLLIGVILIKRVNPQSFHWTMDLSIPLSILVPSALALLGTAVLTAVLAARSASAAGPLQAVRQDW